MRSAWLFVLWAGCGAAPAAAPCPAVAPCPSPTAAVVEAPAPPAPNRCLPTGLSAAPPTPAAARGESACANHARVERALRRELSASFQRTVDGSTVEVSFECDELSEVQTIELELGVGHGTSLTLWRLQRDEDVFRVHGVGLLRGPRPDDSAGPYRREADAFALGRVEATVPTAAVERALARARAALTARVREIEPARPSNGGSGFGSSADFHVVVELEDDEGGRLDGRYTGYEGSPGQRRYLALQLARDALSPLLESLDLAPGEATEADRALFAERLARSAPHLDDPSARWVRERFAWLAAPLGSPSSIPTLLGWLTGRGDDEAGVGGAGLDDADRTRLRAVNALAAITGWDARTRDERWRPIEEVSREYVAECRAGLEPRARGLSSSGRRAPGSP